MLLLVRRSTYAMMIRRCLLKLTHAGKVIVGGRGLLHPMTRSRDIVRPVIELGVYERTCQLAVKAWYDVAFDSSIMSSRVSNALQGCPVSSSSRELQ
jgi:hypothetical protein